MVTIRRCDNCGEEGANSADISISIVPPKFGAPTRRGFTCDLCNKCFEKAAKVFKQVEPQEIIEPGPLEVTPKPSEAASILAQRLARNNQ